MSRAILVVAVLATLAPQVAGCARLCVGDGADQCELPSPCAALAPACGSTDVRMRVLGPGDERPRGRDALAADGDVVLENDHVVAVFDAIDHPNHLSPTGGNLLDFVHATARGADSINHVFQGTGLLPGDQVRYDTMRLVQGDGLRAVELRGSLVGFARSRVATRYELGACDTGLRVRTEVMNGAPDDAVFAVSDALFWGSRSDLPFVPAPGRGYRQESFTLSTIGEVLVETPWVAGAGSGAGSSGYAFVGCNVPAVSGFHDPYLSTAGPASTLVAPGDVVVYERFMTVAPGPGAAPAVDAALAARATLFGEQVVRVRGVVRDDDGRPATSEASAQVAIARGERDLPAAERTPTTEALTDADGAFAADVPAGATYTIEVSSFGVIVATQEVDVGDKDVDVGVIRIPAAGRLTVNVDVDDEPDAAIVFISPADDATRAATTARWHATGPACSPLLGAPDRASPACDRVLIDGTGSFSLPAGAWHVVATAGLFASLAARTITVMPGDTLELDLALRRLPILPAGALGADFHVHGDASYDASIPDETRVRSFIAAGIDVVAATDHDAAQDYAAAITALGVGDRFALMSGVEATPLFLHPFNPSVTYPQVIGHWNFWPMPFIDDAPRNGAPWDELVEPGALIERAAGAGFDAQRGVVELNHPTSGATIGRANGWAAAIGVRADAPLPTTFDGTGPSLFLRKETGAPFGNGDYDAQEVMNGTAGGENYAHRAFWFYLLNQGIVRVGTANSDSHSLTDSVLGTPRSVVSTSVARPAAGRIFDVDGFNADVKAGRVVGTNGPMIEARLVLDDGSLVAPSTTTIDPARVRSLRVVVIAAPWVPVDEVRIIVNGEVARVLDDTTTPADPFGTTGLVRFDGEIDATELLPTAGDAWLLVEAGEAMPVLADLDCDGWPDTGDDNGDGDADWRDVDDDREAPEACSGGTGEIRAPRAALDDPRGPFSIVTPEGYATAFTNPFLFDRSGDGFTGPGL